MSQSVPLLLIAPAAGLLADCAAQIVLSRLAPAAPLRMLFLSFGAGLLVALAILARLLSGSDFMARDLVGYFALHVLIYACCGFCFFNVVSASLASLRVRMLKEYLKRDPRPISTTELSRLYSSREMVRARLERLQAGGQVELTNDRFYLNSGGVLMIGRLFSGLRTLLLGDR